MKFETRDGLILFSNDCEVRHATVFGPTGKLPMRYDSSSCFNDWEHTFTWAFSFLESPQDGQVFVFASVEVEVACVYEAGMLRECTSPGVVRDVNSVPLRRTGTVEPPLTVLIVTMNRRDLLELALWYIYETSDDSERDIWIWDNGSIDDTPAFLGTMQGWPGVRCFRSETNVGLVESRKRMIQHVKTPYVLTLDDDMWLLNRGWATGASQVLAADPSIYQLAISINGHWHNSYGITHTVLDRPFFRVPYMAPGPRRDTSGVQAPQGSELLQIAGNAVIVPEAGKEMPFAVSGAASAWRASDILPFMANNDRHPVMDLSEAWGHILQREGRGRNATVYDYQVVSPCPGPLWHLGRGEKYWERRCEVAPFIYNRTAETQRSWLEKAREASGWGRAIESADMVLPR